jgi:hypothetical protein
MRRPTAFKIVAFTTMIIWILLRYGRVLLGGSSQKKMLLIIDAGSSGTRMNAFQFAVNAHSSKHLTDIQLIKPEAAVHKIPRRSLESRRAYKRVETEPGLHTFSNATSSYPLIRKVALSPLLDWAKAVVPVKQWSSTPVFLFATAGMRKLPKSDQDKILAEARQVLTSESSFLFEDTWARVLSGSDEGLYSWVSLNYAAKVLNSRKREERVGSLDLGGSSLQVTYEMDPVAENFNLNGPEGDQTGVSNFSLLNKRFTMFTRSYSHYGLDDAFERSIVNLLDASKGGSDVDNSFTELVSKSSSEPAANDQPRPPTFVMHPCLPKNYKEAFAYQIPEPSSIVLIGNPDKEACQQLVLQLLKPPPSNCSSPQSCTGHIPLPRLPSDITFVGISGFHVVNHFFGLQDSHMAGNMQKGVLGIRSKAESFCNQTWEEVKEQHPYDFGSETYCFRANYVSSLLVHGLGLEPERVTLDDGTTSWTLGAALVEGSKINGLLDEFSVATSDERKFETTTVVLVLVVLSGLAMTIMMCLLGIASVPRWQSASGKSSFLQTKYFQARNKSLAALCTAGTDGNGEMETGHVSGRPMSRSSTFSRRLYAQEGGISFTDR